jgi:hypothetical protein
MDMSFYLMPFCREAMHMRNMEMSFFAWNMEMSFFVVCPYIFLMFAPKIWMNRTEIVLSSSSCNSSRFSRPCTLSYVKGIQQKKTSPCSSHASLLRKRAYQKKTSPCSIQKKRHRHAEINVSFMNNPEVEFWGHLIKRGEVASGNK